MLHPVAASDFLYSSTQNTPVSLSLSISLSLLAAWLTPRQRCTIYVRIGVEQGKRRVVAGAVALATRMV